RDTAAAHAKVRHLEHRVKTWVPSPGFPNKYGTNSLLPNW
ncbi:unnamed protein product, partial [marine sediment metagenome]